MLRRKRKRWLSQLVFAVAVVAVVAGGAVKTWNWLSGHQDAGKAEARSAGTLDRARTLLNEGQAAEAAALLGPVLARQASPEVLMLLAKAEQAQGNTVAALDHLHHATYDFPNDSAQPRAAIAYGRMLEAGKRFDDAAAVYEKVRARAAPALRAAAVTGLGRQMERKSDFIQARDYFAEALRDATWDSPPWNEALDALGRANVRLIFAPTPTPEAQPYIVQRGDSLTSIGSKLNTTLGLLTRANGIDEDAQLTVGQTLKHTPKDFRIVIERSKCRLFLLDRGGFEDGNIFKRYAVGLGKPGHETTLGVYTIGNKVKDPTWHKPGEGLIPAGDPQNELGTRWMPLVPAREGLPTDLGIHGAIAPKSVGQSSTHGNATLSREAIEELFDLVVRGTPVEIVENYTPHRAE